VHRPDLPLLPNTQGENSEFRVHFESIPGSGARLNINPNRLLATSSWAVRFPIAGNVMHAKEKFRREVAVMKFIKEETSIPVPAVIAFGMA
jgi:hypothetical protein